MKNISNKSIINYTPKLVITHKGLQAIKHIVRIAPQEAQWFHTVEAKPSKDGSALYLYLSEKLYIPTQNTSVAQVDTSSFMMIEFYKELVREEYQDQDIVNQKLSTMTCWCHSHHNMAPNPSQQDHNQFNTFVSSSIDQNQNNWQIMLIFNKKDQFYSRVYDPETGLTWEGVEIVTTLDYDFSYIDQAAKTKFLKPKVKKLSAFSYPKSSWRESNNYTLPYKDMKILNDSVSSDLLTEIYGTPKTDINISEYNPDVILKNIYDCLDERELAYLSFILSNNYNKIKNIFSDVKLDAYLNRYHQTVENRILNFITSTKSTYQDFAKSLSFACSIIDLNSSSQIDDLFDSYYGI